MNLGLWRDISVVLLVLEAFVLTIVPLAVFYFLGRGVTYLLREIPGYFVQVRSVLTQVRDVVVQITDRIVAPLPGRSSFRGPDQGRFGRRAPAIRIALTQIADPEDRRSAVKSQ